MSREIVLVNSYTVRRSPDEVFSMVIDLEREGTWAPTVEKTERISGERGAEGTRYRYHFSLIGRNVTCDYRLHDVRDKEFTVTFESGPSWMFHNSINYAIEASGRDSTLVTLTTTITSLPWFLRLLRPLVVRSIERDYAEYGRCASRYFETASRS